MFKVLFNRYALLLGRKTLTAPDTRMIGRVIMFGTLIMAILGVALLLIPGLPLAP